MARGVGKSFVNMEDSPGAISRGRGSPLRARRGSRGIRGAHPGGSSSRSRGGSPRTSRGSLQKANSNSQIPLKQSSQDVSPITVAVPKHFARVYPKSKPPGKPALARSVSAVTLGRREKKPMVPQRNYPSRSSANLVNRPQPPPRKKETKEDLDRFPFLKTHSVGSAVGAVHKKSSPFDSDSDEESEIDNVIPSMEEIKEETANIASGPTRAYSKARSSLVKENSLSKRLSTNLMGPALSLQFKLADRPELSALRSSMILKDAVLKEPELPLSWATKFQLHDEWLPLKSEEGKIPLIARSCQKSGFKIEQARLNEPGPEDFALRDADKDIKFFDQLTKRGKVLHFAGEKSGGMVIISIEENRNRKVERAIIRTPQRDVRLLVKRGTRSRIKSLCLQCPDLNAYKLVKIHKEDTDNWTKELLKIENQIVERTYKFGILYATDGQTTEDEFFNNVDGSPAFYEFLDSISSKVQLQGWKHFRAGLDVKTNTTGEFSYYQIHKSCEIMFHVSTLIPYYPKDLQQVERKRHFGNDIVVIIFKEGDIPFDPLIIRSQFNHVFAVVSPEQREDKTYYRVEWCCKPGVPPFKPYDTSPAVYEKGDVFKERFLTKLLNAQRASMEAKDFLGKLARTRKLLFEEIAKTYPYKTRK